MKEEKAASIKRLKSAKELALNSQFHGSWSLTAVTFYIGPPYDVPWDFFQDYF